MADTVHIVRIPVTLVRTYAPAPCDPAAMLPVVREQVPIGPPMTIASVQVDVCRNGYARVYAKTGNVPPGTSMETEQVFLRDISGTWVVLTSGTGVGCGDADITPDLKAACVAFGLR
jgi:hypothetical protein